METWDSRDIRGVGVARVGDTLWMLYSAADSRHEYALGLAFSDNGMDWARLDAGPVITPEGSRRAGGVHSLLSPCLAYDGKRLIASASALRESGAPQARLWTSPDGVDWTLVPLRMPAHIHCMGVTWHDRIYHSIGCEGEALDGHGLMGTSLTHLVSDDLVNWSLAGSIPTQLPVVGQPCIVTGPDGRLTTWFTATGPTDAYEVWATTYVEDVWEPPVPALTRAHQYDQTAGVQSPSASWTADGWQVWYIASPAHSDGFRGAVHRATGPSYTHLAQQPRHPVLRVTPGMYVNPS